MKIEKGEYLTIPQYARRKRITNVGALKRIQRGELKARKVGNIWLIKIK